MDNLHIFLGATVADAAARPLHWVYDPKKLRKYIKGKKDITFMKKNKSPFYSIKTGNVSGYNDVGQVMFKTLVSTKKKSDIIKNFKPASQENIDKFSKTIQDNGFLSLFRRSRGRDINASCGSLANKKAIGNG